MFGFLGKIFGSTKVVDAGISAIDSIFHTDQEKTEAKKDLLKLYEPFKLAQRFLAFAVCINFFLFMWVCAAALVWGGDGLSDKLLALANQFEIGYLMLLVMAWYFTGGIVDSVKRK